MKRKPAFRNAKLGKDPRHGPGRTPPVVVPKRSTRPRSRLIPR